MAYYEASSSDSSLTYSEDSPIIKQPPTPTANHSKEGSVFSFQRRSSGVACDGKKVDSDNKTYSSKEPLPGTE